MKENTALEKICPLMSKGAVTDDYTFCLGSECMMWVSTFKPQPQDERKLDNEGYCAFRKTNYSID